MAINEKERIDRINARITRIDYCIGRSKDKAQITILKKELDRREKELAYLVSRNE